MSLSGIGMQDLSRGWFCDFSVFSSFLRQNPSFLNKLQCICEYIIGNFCWYLKNKNPQILMDLRQSPLISNSFSVGMDSSLSISHSKVFIINVYCDLTLSRLPIYGDSVLPRTPDLKTKFQILWKYLIYFNVELKFLRFIARLVCPFHDSFSFRTEITSVITNGQYNKNHNQKIDVRCLNL